MSVKAKLSDILYPPTSPHLQGFLRVSKTHEIFYEVSGNPEGVPVFFLHGGPGAGCAPYHRQFFDPNIYRIVLFDQRGSGRSKPYAELDENTTWDLVSDIESLRAELKINKALIFGGSWGSTLALAYAETHPDRCLALVLRGIFLLRRRDIQWFYQDGCSLLFPDAFDEYKKPIPENERHDFVSAFYKRLTSQDRATRMEAARAWSIWEGTTCTIEMDPDVAKNHGKDEFAEAFARIECHYFINKGFLKSDEQLLEDASRLKDIPTTIVHGRYDVVCPLENAWLLKKQMPHADLHIIADAGHAATEPGIAQALVEACDRYGKILSES